MSQLLNPSPPPPSSNVIYHVQLLATPWTTACQAPLSVGFPREEYWSGLWFPPPGDLPDTGIEPMSPASAVLAGRFLPLAPSGNPTQLCCV